MYLYTAPHAWKRANAAALVRTHLSTATIFCLHKLQHGCQKSWVPKIALACILNNPRRCTLLLFAGRHLPDAVPERIARRRLQPPSSGCALRDVQGRLDRGVNAATDGAACH